MNRTSLSQRLIAKRVQADRRTGEKIRTWIPHEKQEDFIRAKHAVRAFIGSNRSGKSEGGIMEDISYALGYRPFLKTWDPDYRTQFKPPVKIRIFGEDYFKHINGVIIPKLLEWIPKSEINYRPGNPKKNQQGIPILWKFKNGSTIELMSYDQDVDKAEGWDGHLAHFDEPPSRKLFTATWRGLTDHGGICMLTLTPLKEPWIYDEIVLKLDPDFGAYCEVFTVGIQDNVKHERDWYGQTVNTGGLKQENVDRFASGIPEDEKPARIDGKFTHLQGLVFKDFKPSIHVVKPFEIPPHWTRYEHIDTHDQKPWAICFMAIDPSGKKYVYDELEVGGKYENIIDAILMKRMHSKTKRQIKPMVTLIEPAAQIENQMIEQSVIEELFQRSEGKINPEPASKAKERGFQHIFDAILPDEITQEPSFFIFETCKKTIYQFGHLTWENIKEMDDYIEGVYRIMLLDPDYEEVGGSGRKPESKSRSSFERRSSAIAY